MQLLLKLNSLLSHDQTSEGSSLHHLTTAGIEEKSGQLDSSLTEADLAAARAAAQQAVIRSGDDVSVPWEDPATGARGMVTLLATAYVQNGQACRDFLASYVRATREVWLEGQACRLGNARWDVRSLKPWQAP